MTWSYELLAPAEADLFDRLGVFAGAVSLAAIEAVCTDEHLPPAAIAGLLGELVDKSMVVVQRGDHEVRYRLLETMRDFGMNRLLQRGIVGSVRRAHATYYLALAEAEGEHVRGGGEAQAVQAITAAMDDLRAAHVWALTHDDLEVALRLPGALPEEVAFRLRDEVTTWARRALAMPGADQHPARAHALTTSAWGGTSRDECERAVREATQARGELEPDHPVALSALRALATAALYEGRLDDVLALTGAEFGVTDARASDYHRGFLWICHILAHLYRGDLDAAAAALPAIHDSASRSGSPTLRAFAHYCQGEVHLEQDPAHAVVPLTEAVRLGRTVANRLVEGVALVCLATSQGRGHDPGAALNAYREVARHWRRVGDHTHQLTAVRNLVTLLARIDASQEAAVLYGAVTSADTPTFGVEEQRLTEVSKRIRNQLGEATAEVLAAQGRRVESRQVGDEALAVLTALLQR